MILGIFAFALVPTVAIVHDTNMAGPALGAVGRDWFDWASSLGTLGAALAAFGAIAVVLITRWCDQIRNRKTLATILFTEIHNRAARCMLDGITWMAGGLDPRQARPRFDCPKFRPFPPVVYYAMSDRLTELSPEVAQRVVRFYNALEAADRQMTYLTEHPQECKTSENGATIPSRVVNYNETRLVTARLHQMLQPALDALNALCKHVDQPKKMETDLREGDRSYLADAQVLRALTLTDTPLLRDALQKRIEHFRTHPEIGKFAAY